MGPARGHKFPPGDRPFLSPLPCRPWPDGTHPVSRVQVPSLFDFDSDPDFDLDFFALSLLAIGPGVSHFPPLSKGGQGGFFHNLLEIPLNPPFSKGDFLTAELSICITQYRYITL